MIGAPKGVIGGILSESASEISLRTKVTGCGKAIEGEVLALGAFERIVPFVADEGEARTADARGQRKQTKFGRRKVRSQVAGFHVAVIEAVGDGCGVIRLLLADLLAEIDFTFLPLRGESGNIQTVVVEDGVEDLEAVVVEELRNFVTNEAALLQASYVGLEGQGLIPAADVEAGDIEPNTGAHAGGAGRRTGP